MANQKRVRTVTWKIFSFAGFRGVLAKKCLRETGIKDSNDSACSVWPVRHSYGVGRNLKWWENEGLLFVSKEFAQLFSVDKNVLFHCFYCFKKHKWSDWLHQNILGAELHPGWYKTKNHVLIYISSYNYTDDFLLAVCFVNRVINYIFFQGNNALMAK